MTAPSPSSALAQMHPAYFAMAMATGIVSIASQLLGMRFVALALYVVNVIVYVALWGLTVARLLRHRQRVIADLFHHGRSVGFFTTVAATCVLGSQSLVVGGLPSLALGLWFAGIVLWAVFTYTIITILTVKAEKPTLADGINGGWLVIVVASHSVAVLGAQLAPSMSHEHAPKVLLFALTMWLGGSMLYIWIISLIFYRYTFFTLSPNDLAPPYWINMGAVAITTFAGATLILNASAWSFLQEILPFLKGFTLFSWSIATWWIPLLLILGIWRHVYKRVPLTYDPQYWGMVFPLGMYTVSTFEVARATGLAFLFVIPQYTIYLALAAWLVVAIGLIYQLR